MNTKRLGAAFVHYFLLYLSDFEIISLFWHFFYTALLHSKLVPIRSCVQEMRKREKKNQEKRLKRKKTTDIACEKWKKKYQNQNWKEEKKKSNVKLHEWNTRVHSHSLMTYKHNNRDELLPFTRHTDYTWNLTIRRAYIIV